MTGPISETSAMIAQMNPVLDEKSYCFCEVTPDIAPQALGAALATFREAEGVSAIIPQALARELELDLPVFARITLQVNSDLEGVGLTAAVSAKLAEAGIACNVVAALHHDHVFVPAARGQDALDALKKLQSQSQSD